MKRIFDITVSFSALALLSPLFLLSAAGIKLTSPGPVFFRARRAGKGNIPFLMYKFRTMHVRQPRNASKITAAHDPRLFPFGKLLRALKIDELPQLINVFKGEMSIVGPRPEDVAIVAGHYTPWMMETLDVLPGMASPGSIDYSISDYRREQQGITVNDPERDYIDTILPMKLAIELVYIQKHSFLYDIRVIFRTMYLVVQVAFGKRIFANVPEYDEAAALLTRLSS